MQRRETKKCTVSTPSNNEKIDIPTPQRTVACDLCATGKPTNTKNQTPFSIRTVVEPTEKRKTDGKQKHTHHS